MLADLPPFGTPQCPARGAESAPDHAGAITASPKRLGTAAILHVVVPALQFSDKGDSATGGACRVLASTRAVTCSSSAPRGSSRPSLTSHVRGRKRIFRAQADQCFAPQEE